LRAFNETVTSPSAVESSAGSKPARTRRPDRAVYVPRARRSQTTPSGKGGSNDHHNSSSPFAADEEDGSSVPAPNPAITGKPVIVKSLRKSESIDESALSVNCKVSSMAPSKKQSMKIIDDRKTSPKKDDGEREERELKKASQEMNRASKRIIKQTFNSDVLEIDPPEKAKLKESKSVNPEEDDWESMFDDNGDCLDPNLLDELTAQVGKVTIEKPKTDYKVYQTKQALLLEEEFPHVLEVSNFPMEFKTQDLMMIFSPYKESGFDIKWVDDTHALAVFSNSRVAAEVLSMCHPFVKLKPLAQATSESRNKAKKCSSSLQPYRQRPETCAALARRLVTGALGVKLSTAREERENERKVLREARERKLLAAKQRDEIWDSLGET